MFEHVPVVLNEMEAETTETGRTYRTPEGINLPSITTVLSILSRDSIAKWRKRVGEEEADRISYRASTRGTAVHEIIEKYLDNKEDYRDGYTPDIIESFINIKPVLDGRIGRIYAQEAPLYSTHLGVAGRVDCVAEFDGKRHDIEDVRRPYLHPCANLLIEGTFELLMKGILELKGIEFEKDHDIAKLYGLIKENLDYA